MDQAQREKILAHGGLSREWQAEPMLSGWFTEAVGGYQRGKIGKQGWLTVFSLHEDAL